MAERVLYLVRHGQADGHDEASQLTDHGREQAARAAARLVRAGIGDVHHGGITVIRYRTGCPPALD